MFILQSFVKFGSGSDFSFDADPNRDPTQVLHIGKSEFFFFTFIHSSAGQHCLFFLFSVRALKFFNISDSILKFSGVNTDPEPDRQALDADQDLAK
jgi:hypothetical protein